MDSRKIVYRETAVVAAGVAICSAIMFGVYALMGKFDMSVLWGGLVGTGVAADQEPFPFLDCLCPDFPIGGDAVRANGDHTILTGFGLGAADEVILPAVCQWDCE